LLGFYKGTATPLVGVGACVSIQFGTFEFMKRELRRDSPLDGSSVPHLTMTDFYIAGGTAGVANCIVACIFKIRD
jgi:solute carrier family 25 (mitochondrial carnitine/acylcarnitine transporter), member 20/29